MKETKIKNKRIVRKKINSACSEKNKKKQTKIKNSSHAKSELDFRSIH